MYSLRYMELDGFVEGVVSATIEYDLVVSIFLGILLASLTIAIAKLIIRIALKLISSFFAAEKEKPDPKHQEVKDSTQST